MVLLSVLLRMVNLSIHPWSIKLTDEQMEALLPYCNALDFEPYRNREMKMREEGYIGYRDEAHLYGNNL